MEQRQFIPFHRPSIGEEEIREVVDTLRSGWLTSGARTERFEQEFRQYVGSRHALAVNSCTAALHLALAALDIGPDDEVITTPLTFCATVNTILHVGATPVLADVDATGNLDPESVKQRITRRTRAIIPVHLAGLPCDMQAIWGLARQHRLHVVEDAAHAAGTHYHGVPLGSIHAEYFSDAVAFSFYATKNMTTGEGGMVTTNHEALAARMRVLCLHGINKDAWNRYADKGSWYYRVLEPGFKYNLSDIQSAIGIHQLHKLEQFIATRSLYAEIYQRHFQDVEELETPPDCVEGRHSWHLYVLRLNTDKLSVDRDQFIRELQERGVGVSVHFIPIPLHPFFARASKLAHNQCPQALQLYSRIVSLPLYPGMTEDQVHYVAKSVKDVVAQCRRPMQVAAGFTVG